MSLSNPILWVKLGAMLLGLLLGLIWLAPARPDGAPSLWTRRRPLFLALLSLLAFSAFAAHLNFFRNEPARYLHFHDLSHYVFGSRYARETGYFDLYRCLAQAEADLMEAKGNPLPREMRERKIRVLETYDFMRLETAVRSPDERALCRARFTPERWEKFKRDLDDFNHTQFQTILYDRLNDLGYNGAPVWSLLAGSIAELVPINRTGMGMLALLDPLLLLTGFLLLLLAFGAEAGLFALIFFLTNHFFHPPYIHGSFLRYDWMAALLIGVALLKLDRPRLSGVFIAYAAVVRIFPGVMALGLLTQWGVLFILGRPRPPATARFLAGFFATSLLLVAAGLLFLGPDLHLDYIRKLTLHKDLLSSSRVGLFYATLRLDLGAPAATLLAKKVILLVLAHLTGFALIVLCAKSEPWEAAVWPIPFIFVLTALTVYYGVIVIFLLLLPPFSGAVRSRRLWWGLLWGVFLLFWGINLQLGDTVRSNTFVSDLLLAVTLLLLVPAFLRDRPLFRAFLRESLRRFRALGPRAWGGLALLVVGAVALKFASASPGSPEWAERLEGELTRLEFDPGSDRLLVSPSRILRPAPALVARYDPLQADIPNADPFYDARRLFFVGTPEDPSLFLSPARPTDPPVRIPLGVEERGLPVALTLFRFVEGKRSDVRLLPFLRTASVWRVEKGERFPCPRIGDRFVCQAEDWTYVGPTSETVGGVPARMIWAHPEGEELVIRYPDLPMGSELILSTALTDFAAALEEGAPVELSVFFEEIEIAKWSHLNEAGVKETRIDTRPWGGGRGGLELRVRSGSNARRHFLFDGLVLP